MDGEKTSRDALAAARLRLALRSLLGTEDPYVVLAPRTVLPQEGLALLERVRRQSEGWTDEERGAWVAAIEKSIDWTHDTPPEDDLELRRMVHASGLSYLQTVDRDIEDAVAADAEMPFSRPAPASFFLDIRAWRSITIPFWLKLLYLSTVPAAAYIVYTVLRRPLPIPDAARAAAIARRIVWTPLALLFAPLTLVWQFFRLYTFVRRTRPLPRNSF